jgi:excisionase family DNA binding protein
MAMLHNEMMPIMLTVRDVARLLNIHVNTVRRWGDQGILQSYRITRRGDRRFMREDIDSFLIELNSNGGDPKKTYLAHNGSSDEE